MLANPDAAVNVIAKAAGVKVAVAKTELATLTGAGRLTHTVGGRGENGRRVPDTWTPAPGATAAPAAANGGTGQEPDGTTAPVPGSQPQPAAPAVDADTIAEAMRLMSAEADRRKAAEAELAAKVAEEEARRAEIMAELEQARTAEDTRRALTDLLGAVTATYAAVVAGDQAATAAGLEQIFTATHTVKVATGAASGRARTRTGTGGTGGGVSRAGRATPRPLRPEVIAHLRAHPSAEFTPGEIGRVLDRSSGAVANALDKLVEMRLAVLTGDRPARYRLATPDPGTATGGTDGGTAAGPGTGDTDAPAANPATDVPAATADADAPASA